MRDDLDLTNLGDERTHRRITRLLNVIATLTADLRS